MSAVNATPEPQDERTRRLAEVQLDIQRLVEVCTERGVPEVDGATIDRVVKILRADSRSMTAEQEEELWRLRATLSRLARPATCSGLRLLSILDGTEREKGGPAKSVSELKHWIGLFFIPFLIFGALVHGYAHVGKVLFDRSERNSVALGAILNPNQDASVTEATKASTTNDGDKIKGSVNVSDLILACNQAVHALGQLREWRHVWLKGGLNKNESTACEQLYSASGDLKSMTAIVGRFRSLVADPLSAEGARATLILKIVMGFLLPAFYGILGAFVFDLRGIANRAEQGALQVVHRYRYRVRLLLGAIFGLAISTLFDFSSDVAVPRPITEPILAAAFVAGYSIEAVFSILDLVVVRLRNAITGTEEKREGGKNNGVPSGKIETQL